MYFYALFMREMNITAWFSLWLNGCLKNKVPPIVEFQYAFAIFFLNLMLNINSKFFVIARWVKNKNTSKNLAIACCTIFCDLASKENKYTFLVIWLKAAKSQTLSNKLKFWIWHHLIFFNLILKDTVHLSRQDQSKNLKKAPKFKFQVDRLGKRLYTA